jgi:2-polyprenyl-3-methyl-5-hydroxy-6-metoxy-1,4-benzoquinol methylase
MQGEMNQTENCNRFDKVCMDIEQRFEEQDMWLSEVHEFDKNSSTSKERKFEFFKKILFSMKMFFLGFLYKSFILQKLIYSNLMLGWFYEFRKFWMEYLKNRPIDIIDFHFLRINYRIKFQSVAHEDEKDPEKFIKAWQKYENIHLLLQSIWNNAKSAYLSFYPFLRYIPNNAHILEYGCGVAPLTEGLIRYCPYKNLRFTIADIKQVNYLYARWKFAQRNHIRFVTINPAIYDNLPQNEMYDVIVCLAVFEHLPNPYEIVEVFYDHLKQGGVLIFDYIKGEGKGLDSKAGLTDRKKVLAFIEKNLNILEGKIDYKDNTALIIATKI